MLGTCGVSSFSRRRVGGTSSQPAPNSVACGPKFETIAGLELRRCQIDAQTACRVGGHAEPGPRDRVAEANGLTTLTVTNIPSGQVITITPPAERCPFVAAQLTARGGVNVPMRVGIG
jgi:hypothetical protein